MKEDANILKLVYTFFLGIIVALFIGIGIDTFYPQPEMPRYPTELSALNGLNKEPTAQQIAMQNTYDKNVEAFNKNKMNPYNRNVSIMSLGAAVVLLALSMFLEKKSIRVISDGVMLGGLFILIYSFGRGVASQDSKYMFIAVSVGLVVVLYLGYHRFVHARNFELKPTK